MSLEENLLNNEDNSSFNREIERHGYKKATFREYRQAAGTFGPYQKRLFVMMGFYWITASFFLILPFYFFKRPMYCEN